jgi:hypothetical protein
MFVFVTFASFNLQAYGKKYKHYDKFNNDRRIIINMQKIIATKPWTLRNKKLYPAALVYAFIIIICTLGQLFRFDKLLGAAIAEPLFTGRMDVFFWCLLAIVQVVALVYLLRIKVSLLMRYVGLVCSLLVPIFWTVIVIWQVQTGSVQFGVFGAEVTKLNAVGISALMAFVASALASLSLRSIGFVKPSDLSK